MIETTYRARDYSGTAQDEMHFHADFELLYVTRGWAMVEAGGRCWHAAAPSLVFFGNLEVHRIVESSPDYERYVLTVPPEQMRGVPPSLPSIFRNRPESFKPVVDTRECPADLPALFQALALESARKQEHAQLCAESLVRLLLTAVYRFRPQAFPATMYEYPTEIIEAQHYIDEHFAQEIAVADVAKRFYMSPSYFRHQFLRLIGYSPKQYIMLSRLAAAREMLGETALSVGEIAEKVGFSDSSNFIRRFKAHYGVTPNALRKKA